MEGKPDWVKRRTVDLSDEEVTATRRQYCAAIELIDDQVGAILSALEERGMAENTYVVFASDHGEMLGDHGLYTKSLPYEGALRVPLIIAGPGIQGGRVSDALVELMDVNPTLCDFAGVPGLEGVDALSLDPVLSGSADAHRSEGVSVIRNFQCIRTASHKLVVSANDTDELYDLETDPDELRNIAAEERAIVRDLRGRLTDRLAEGKWLH
jgi:choline-sulfatase